jgi:hypothetical protein
MGGSYGREKKRGKERKKIILYQYFFKYLG